MIILSGSGVVSDPPPLSGFLLQENSPRIKPPPGWRIDPKHPLSTGLVFYVTPGNTDQIERVGRGVATLEGTTSSWTALFMPEGFGVQVSGTTRRLHYPWNPLIESITDRCTILMKLGYGAVTSNGNIFSIPYRTNGTWTSPNISLHLGRSGSTSALGFNYASAGTQVNVVSDTGMLGTGTAPLYMIGVSRSGPDVLFYRDGFQHGAAKTLGTNTVVDWGSRARPTFFNRASDSSGEDRDGNLSWAAIWNRTLSAAEILHFTNAPFQILIP